jgi:hypothetical protein
MNISAQLHPFVRGEEGTPDTLCELAFRSLVVAPTPTDAV